MVRLPRLDLPAIAQRIIQRGDGRQACFADDADYLRYGQELGEAALKRGCALHAYVLMTNHVHLPVTPSEAGAVSRTMQAIGRRYVSCFNTRYFGLGSRKSTGLCSITQCHLKIPKHYAHMPTSSAHLAANAFVFLRPGDRPPSSGK